MSGRARGGRSGSDGLCGLTGLPDRSPAFAYVAPQHALEPHGLDISLDTAGNNLIVVRTLVGQAQPTALLIDGARFPEVVGTVAGDDTIFIAVRNGAAQRLAVHKIVGLFAGEAEKA